MLDFVGEKQRPLTEFICVVYASSKLAHALLASHEAIMIYSKLVDLLAVLPRQPKVGVLQCHITK